MAYGAAGLVVVLVACCGDCAVGGGGELTCGNAAAAASAACDVTVLPCTTFCGGVGTGCVGAVTTGAGVAKVTVMVMGAGGATCCGVLVTWICCTVPDDATWICCTGCVSVATFCWDVTAC